MKVSVFSRHESWSWSSCCFGTAPGSSLTCTLLLDVNNKRDMTLTEVSAEHQPRSASGESCPPEQFPHAEEVALRMRSLTGKSLNYKPSFWIWWRGKSQLLVGSMQWRSSALAAGTSARCRCNFSGVQVSACISFTRGSCQRSPDRHGHVLVYTVAPSQPVFFFLLLVLVGILQVFLLPKLI